MIRQALALSITLMSLSSPFALADQHCACSKECMTQCQKGGSKGCECKSCDCAKSGKCSHGKCSLEDHKDHAEAK